MAHGGREPLFSAKNCKGRLGLSSTGVLKPIELGPAERIIGAESKILIQGLSGLAVVLVARGTLTLTDPESHR